MDSIFDIAQIIIGILLIAAILLQQKGGGLGSAFGGGETIASTRRGAEKGLFTISIILSALFLGLAALRMFL
ncbi:MAG: preprotein translocase subunit SecG [Candidatus Kerfeldbacteria bacterium]